MSLLRTLRLSFKTALLGLFLIICLASEYLNCATLPWPPLNQAQVYLYTIFRARDAQWLVVVCLSLYLFGFSTYLCSSGRSRSPDEILFLIPAVAFFLLGASAYGINYEQAAKKTDALLCFFGITLNLGLRFWRRLELSRTEPFNVSGAIDGIMLILLSVAAVFHPESMQSFQYRGQARWSGPWLNPNTFGTLMGVGVTLALGHLFGSSLGKQCRRPRAKWLRSVMLFLFLVSASVCGLGLVKSYSRGAWAATVAGLAYLAHTRWRVFDCGDVSTLSSSRPVHLETCDKSSRSRLERYLFALVIIISIAVLAFWSFRHTEQVTLRRAMSVGNMNDFSWRNRLAAWEGSLQMMASRPFLGFGWNQPERVYDQFYLRPNLDVGMAIQLNDYFMLGMTLGLPGLACFLACVSFSLARRAEGEERFPDPLRKKDRLKATYRASTIVLLVAFWFDAGLFKLATCAPFWILLEMGRHTHYDARKAETAAC